MGHESAAQLLSRISGENVDTAPVDVGFTILAGGSI